MDGMFDGSVRIKLFIHGFTGELIMKDERDRMLEVIWPGKTLEDIEDKYIRIKVEGKNAIIYGFRFE